MVRLFQANNGQQSLKLPFMAKNILRGGCQFFGGRDGSISPNSGVVERHFTDHDYKLYMFRIVLDLYMFRIVLDRC